MVSAMTTNGLKKRLEKWNQVNWRKVNKAVIPILCEVAYNREIAFMVRL